ncbi:MAG: phosphoenolpyruvate carboxykinase (ATP) [Lentisphaeraceae bacterium]|nr:phosphoenolpyruvate carboxykinase (ATP) [Lentisphaeraceae bacterium]
MVPDLSNLNISPSSIHYNPSYDEIFHDEVEHHEGTVTANGTFAVDTGKFTGRSPKDKYFVVEPSSEENIWWGPVNQKISNDIYQELKGKVVNHLNGKELYVTDAFCGASDTNRLNVRVLCQYAWQAHFCKNMFIRPEEKELEGFDPDFTILNACQVSDEKWQEHGLNSEVFVIFNMAEKMAIIGGTFYGGEMKKGVFSVMNYLLPLKDILTMHCSANKGSDDKTTLFFGLSGTGKTTLSSDLEKDLIGDDEHGWDDEGIFNFEGGCYAKTINLDAEQEPEIYDAIKRDALLENVVIDPVTKEVDYTDSSKTQNTRVSYPIYHIEHIVPESKGPHPSSIIFLTCDAFGVLPPVSKLTKEQAMYYFLSGYTAKVAGTERGVKEPIATFSPCFGGPFLTLHPTKYADLLGKKIDTHDVPVYLVNTGWTGGPYGVGSRMSLPATRAIVHAIQNGCIEQSGFESTAYFNLQIPTSLEGVDQHLLNPENAWNNKEDYKNKAKQLAEMFIDNFHQYEHGDFDFHNFGPSV